MDKHEYVDDGAVCGFVGLDGNKCGLGEDYSIHVALPERESEWSWGSRCVECGKQIPAGQMQHCLHGGYCNHHVPVALRAEIASLRASHKRLVEALERAQTLLSATVKFIDANPIGEYTVHYDEAECDGLCLADDCRTAESSADAALADARKLEGK